MPPKKKQGKSKSKKKGKEVDPAEQQRQDLLQRALALQGEASQEDALEKQFSRQSELLRGYWETEKKTREGRERDLVARERRLRGVKDEHAVKLSEYKKTVKELLFHNQDELSERTTQSFVECQSLSDRHQSEVGQMHNELHDITNRLRETSMSHDKYKISMRQSRDDGATALREEAGHRIATLAAYSEEQFRKARREYEKKLMGEMKDTEDRNEVEIGEAMKTNQEEVQKMRTEYDVTMNDNLDLIVTLRKEVVLLRERDREDRRVLSELQSQNDDIVLPLEAHRKDLGRLEDDLGAFRKQKQDLDAQKKALERAVKELTEIEWDREVLFQKLQALENDRDEWKERAQHSIHSARQKANFRNLLLERKLKRSSMAGDKNTATMAEILHKANVDLDSLDQSQVRITDVVKDKNDEIAMLQQTLSRIKDAHKAMMERYQYLVKLQKDK
ncbi:hypothetical protein ACHAWF_006416 [Thalassiosira exigua]